VSEQLGLGGFRHTGFRPVTVAEPEVPIIEGGPSIAPEPPRCPPPAEEAPVPEEPPRRSPRRASAAATSSTGHEPTAAQRRLSRRLMQIDRELRTKLQAAADAALHRALERAGNRLRARARANSDAAAKVDGVPGPLVAAALGRALVAALDADDADLLRDAFERLRTQWTEWTATAAEDAIDTAARITGLDRSDVAVQRTVAALRDSFAGGAEAAWPALEAQLTDLATGLMYEPDPQVEALGEIPDTMVPPGVIRAALAAAGGLPSDHDGIRALSGLTSGTAAAGVHARRRGGAGGVRVGLRDLLPAVPPARGPRRAGVLRLQRPRSCPPPGPAESGSGTTSPPATTRAATATPPSSGPTATPATSRRSSAAPPTPSRSPASPSPAGMPPWTARPTPPAPDPPPGAEETQ
jgi:hypothetical protein